MANVLHLDYVALQYRRLADALKGNIDAEASINDVTALFITDREFQDHLNTLPRDLMEEVTEYGRERLRALGWPRPSGDRRSA